MKVVPLFLLFVVSTISCSSSHRFEGNCDPPSHMGWTALLRQYVSADGTVDYAGFVQDSVRLNDYCRLLSDCPPNRSWSEEEKLAYWINVYNAFTVKLIVDHYPVASIKDIKKGIPMFNSVWEMKFFKIGGSEMSLGQVEHGILRKEFNEPRIHFVIVCASKSCPTLWNGAYTAPWLEIQLQTQTKKFFNDPTKNRIGNNGIELSAIFKWFKKDFTDKGPLRDWIKEYYEGEVDPEAKITYLDYDWSLNGK